MSLRQEYLKNWNPYQPYKEGIGVRVVDIDDDGLVLQVHGESKTFHNNDEISIFFSQSKPWKNLDLKQLQDLFSPGDWLILQLKKPMAEVQQTSDIQCVYMAAPNLTKGTKVLQVRPYSRLFSKFVEDVRAWFLQNSFFSAQTPSLVTCPGMEPTLVPFKIEDSTGKRSFLPTSPELYLKKMMCRGYGDLFEIKRVFRNELSTSHHQPEFLMLEWYRCFSGLEKIEGDLKQLINWLMGRGWSQQDLKIENWTCETNSGLFQQYLNFDLKPETSHSELIQLSRQLEVGTQADDDSWDDTFFKIFLSRIETEFTKSDFLTLRNYPPSQAALARCNSEGWAERMELYIRGVEVGNAFDELNDPVLQRERFVKDQKQRRDQGLVDLPVDQEFLDHLNAGMPPSAGIAVGLERLFMGLMGVEEISELQEFPHRN